jgi:hypothetical protein
VVESAHVSAIGLVEACNVAIELIEQQSSQRQDAERLLALEVTDRAGHRVCDKELLKLVGAAIAMEEALPRVAREDGMRDVGADFRSAGINQCIAALNQRRTCNARSVSEQPTVAWIMQSQYLIAPDHRQCRRACQRLRLP